MSEWLSGFDKPLEQLGKGESSVSEMLEILLERSRLAKQLPLTTPQVTLMLATGNQLTGTLIAQSTQPSRTLTFALHTGGYEQQLCFIAASQVMGVVVHDVLNLGSVRDDAEVPSRLELSRQAQTLSDEAGITISLEVDENSKARLVMQHLLTQLQTILPSITADGAGKETLAALSGIRLKAGSSSVGLEQKELVISADLNALQTTQTLQQRIEALL